MQQSHENKVEAFYSHGARIRGTQDGGFLSFGLWTQETDDYHQAVEALIQHVLAEERPLHGGTILNVACGFGAETLEIFEKMHPGKIIAIDITEAHIQFAKNHIASMGLGDRIQFEKMNACQITYPQGSFDYVIGIEGPAHFRTRELFLEKAFKILKPGGVLLLTDVVADQEGMNRGLYNRWVANFCAKHWYMPKENWMFIQELVDLLGKMGYKIDKAESLGAKVYPGFSHFNLRWKSIANAVRIRGLRIGLLLTLISWLLGHVYRRKIIDYVFIRAEKPRAKHGHGGYRANGL